ncbi:MAG: hypothetical protein RBS05_12845 [Zoogloea oleivorans]|jgi:hypothetical protein|uniref:hypothetical protein n=1 Tax=Zoogloea oleivorans TaxID=1552750 RepID=UPI002A3714D1|nr:hypothetical protein [Zoogloea oleivorans]MDY0036789.1 hypothetical protein [Zoogloea oleivorans]
MVFDPFPKQLTGIAMDENSKPAAAPPLQSSALCAQLPKGLQVFDKNMIFVTNAKINKAVTSD